MGTTFREKLRVEATQVKEPVVACQRGTFRHAEFGSSSNFFHKPGEGVVPVGYYGNLGTAGVLTAGDIFNCDINGDRTYDENTERFYYITGNEEKAAMSYYTVLASQPTDWKNIKQVRNLTKSEIETATGVSIDTSLGQSANKDLLVDYHYLFENLYLFDSSNSTDYLFYALDGSYQINAWSGTICEGSDCSNGPGGKHGVRPAIEVSKSNIIY